MHSARFVTKMVCCGMHGTQQARQTRTCRRASELHVQRLLLAGWFEGNVHVPTAFASCCQTVKAAVSAAHLF
jgi:hypothetical protein